MMETLTIGQAAKRARVGIETIRFYERKKMIEAPPRTPSGYRQYPQTVVRRIRFIKRAQSLGFTLKEIQELMELRFDPLATCGDVKEEVNEKIKDVEQKIKTLNRIKKALKKLAATCDGNGDATECPVLEALDSGEELYET